MSIKSKKLVLAENPTTGVITIESQTNATILDGVLNKLNFSGDEVITGSAKLFGDVLTHVGVYMVANKVHTGNFLQFKGA